MSFSLPGLSLSRSLRWVLLAVMCLPSFVSAQLVPTGGHYAARASDTGFGGGVTSEGQFASSVPLDLPSARDDLPVPLHITFGGHSVGAAGLGWDVPLSYIRRDTTIAGRRPANFPDAAPQAREQLTLVLDGQHIDLVRNAGGTGWVARRNGPQLQVRDLGGGSMLAYDGEGRTYAFSAEGGSAGSRMDNGKFYLLRNITSGTGNNVHLEYAIGAPALPGGGAALSINLINVSYNRHPTTSACIKHRINLNYDSPVTPPLSVSMLGTTAVVRTQKLLSVDVTSRATCTSSAVSLRVYRFEYQVDADTQQPQLQKVDMIGEQGTPERYVTLPVAIYGYGKATNGAGALAYRKTQSVAVPTGFVLSGISGTDGLIAAGGAFLAYGQGVAQFTWQGLTDINGDGRPDLVFRGGPDLNAVFNQPGPNGTTLFSGALIGQQLTGGPGNELSGRSLEESSSEVDRSPLLLGTNKGMTWRQSIDVNGDGRLDIVDAQESAGSWVVYLNIPSLDTPNHIAWHRREIPIGPIVQHLQQAGHTVDSNFVPLSKRVAGHDTSFFMCWEWRRNAADGTFHWVKNDAGFSGPPQNHCEGSAGSLLRHSDKSITEWELRDINGDGYPDLVFDASPVKSFIASDLPPPAPGSFEGQFQRSAQEAVVDLFGSSDLDVMFNVAGVQLLPFTSEVFAAPTLLAHGTGCGVEQWGPDLTLGTRNEVSVQLCGFEDLNADGLVDRVTYAPGSVASTVAALGTGDINEPFSTKAIISIPGPLARINTHLKTDDTGRPAECPDLSSSDQRFSIQRTVGLRDLTADGIPDYIVGDNSTGSTAWSVAIGTGSGFAPARAIDMPAGFSLSQESVRCPGLQSRADTPAGLYDIDGDGQPEVVVLSGSHLDIYQLNGPSVPNGLAAGAPTAGRLVSIDNGYGAVTGVIYRSAKEDATTLHSVAFPEVVATAVLTRDSAGVELVSPTLYAYGGAQKIFDPAYNAFVFRGYQRSIELRNSGNQIPAVAGVATVSDMYGLTPFDESIVDPNARFERYMKVGKVSDVTVISGSVGADPWALLGVDINADGRRIASTHYDWDTRILPTGPSGNEFCFDLMFPYDYRASVLNLRFDEPDQCTEHGFIFQNRVTSWRGTPGTSNALASAQTVQMRSEVKAIDDFARVTSLRQDNDVRRDDDNLCLETVYAEPKPGTNERILSAPRSRVTTNCAASAPDVKTFTKDIWEYDTQPGEAPRPGEVTRGLVTSHTVSRFDTVTGQALGDIREFDATFDPLTGKLNTLLRTREDGAAQKVITTYDSFGLVPVSERTEATGGPTSIPGMQFDSTIDPLLLTRLSVTDPNGTTQGTLFDGFGRALLTTVTVPDGSEGATSLTAYLGFAANETGGRRVATKEFTDPVVPASAATAAGRTDTLFIDAMGRQTRSEIQLGADYQNRNLIVGQRTFDPLGRVLFEADPFPSNESFSTAYGTTQYFNTDGTPSCSIRGSGKQTFTRVTVESAELYPTCFERSFENGVEKFVSTDASSSLAGSPQEAIHNATYATAIGRTLQRITYRTSGSVTSSYLERLGFKYDALGNTIGMIRYRDPVPAAAEPSNGSGPVEVDWHYDSLGWITRLDEPDTAPQNRTFDAWGGLTVVQWNDPTLAPAPGGDRRTVTQFDALGRVVHREDRTNNVKDPETVNDFVYDQPFTVTAGSTTIVPGNVRGRLAKASAPTSVTTFGYDGFGQINAQVTSDVATAKVYIEKRDVHADGSWQTLHLLLPDNAFKDEKIDYAYDSAGRMRSVKYNDGTNRDLFTASGNTDIDAFGRVHQAKYGPATYSAVYSDSGRRLLSDMRVASPSSSASREISYQAVAAYPHSSYDPVGRQRIRRDIKDGVPSAPLIHEYDAVGQLSARKQLDESTFGLLPLRQFSYDPLGNLTRQDVPGSPAATGATQLSYQTVDLDRVCSVGFSGATPPAVCNIKYDGVGNILELPSRSNGIRKLTYFANGQVKTITNGSTNATFRYDAFGAVQQLVLNTGLGDARHDKHFGPMLWLRDEAGAPVLTRTIPIPGVVATRHGPGGPWTFAFGEGRGNRFVTDQNGAFVQDMDYQPYGEVIPSGTALPGSLPGSQLYTSEQWNSSDLLAALGLSQLGARIYDPVLGRFVSRDPLIAPSTATAVNPYAFAANDPVDGSDPNGTEVIWDIFDSEGETIRIVDTIPKPTEGPQTPQGKVLQTYLSLVNAPKMGNDFNLDNLADGVDYYSVYQTLQQTQEAVEQYAQANKGFNDQLALNGSFFAGLGDGIMFWCPGCTESMRDNWHLGTWSANADPWAYRWGSATSFVGSFALGAHTGGGGRGSAVARPGVTQKSSARPQSSFRESPLLTNEELSNASGGAGGRRPPDVVTASGQRASPNGTPIGPSGEPVFHYSNSATRKQMIDGAKHQGVGPVEFDAARGPQPDHYHAVGADGQRISGPQKTHFNKRGSR